MLDDRVRELCVRILSEGNKELVDLAKTILHEPSEPCIWTISDNGIMGFRDLEYHTTCGKSFDPDQLHYKNKFCLNCGKPVIHK